MFNLQSTPNPFTYSTVSFDTKFLPLSEIMTDGQPCLLTNRLKLLMNELESICGTTCTCSRTYIQSHPHLKKCRTIFSKNTLYKQWTEIIYSRNEKKQNHCLFVIGITEVKLGTDKKSFVLFANNTFWNNISYKLPASANPTILS